jgi:light-regulated signal transduction histidine kinase (bacteriophytochrome)
MRQVNQRIYVATERMNKLIKNLLRLSRISRLEIKRQPVDLSMLARSIASELRASEPNRQVEFAIQPDMIVNADRELIRVLMEKLLGNVWKFRSNHVSAAIEFGKTERDGKRVYFVRDNGTGFDTGYAERLFIPFQRLHSTEEFGGTTGIGLATV